MGSILCTKKNDFEENESDETFGDFFYITSLTYVAYHIYEKSN